MLNEYKNFLIKSGYAVETNRHSGSTCYDYCRALKRVSQFESMTIEELAKNIFDICPMYEKGGQKQILGSGMSRSIRSSLVQLRNMVSENQVAA